MESEPEIMVKSGLDFFLDPSMGKNIFLYIIKGKFLTYIINSVTKITCFPHGGIKKPQNVGIFHHHFDAQKGNFRFHFDQVNDG